MHGYTSKSGLAILLSKLSVYERPNILFEQYPTDSEIAAEVLWFAAMRGDIVEKRVADFGCGTGVLGIGALSLGAEKVFFIDIDSDALSMLKANIKRVEEETGLPLLGRFEIINSDILSFSEKVDTVVENPPFGVRDKHADKPFLEKAFEVSDVIYSIHKAESNEFINKISQKSGFLISNHFEFDFPIKKTQKFHKEKIHRFRAGCWRMEKVEK